MRLLQHPLDGRKSNVETVGSIANWANLLLEGRGEKLELSAKGYGSVTEVEDNRLAVNFDVAGDKRVMDAYVDHV